jgi:hypothetical protein
MPAWLLSLLESFGTEAAAGAAADVGAEAVMSGGAAPVSLGQQVGDFVGGQISQQAKPMMDVYNTFNNPNATPMDQARKFAGAAYQPNEDEKNLMFKPMPNAYGGMSNNYVGGIPSLLQNTGSGILPYIGSR